MINYSAEKLDSGFLNKINLQDTPLQKINDPEIANYGVELFVYRIDLIHPQISGNKWFKLKYNLVEAESKGYKKLLTFGGAFSNHIYATAAAGKIFGFKTIGMIRGEKHLPLNPTLSFAEDCGMEFHYLDRTVYRRRYDKDFLIELEKKIPGAYFIPEGGTNLLAVQGCTEIHQNIKLDFDIVCSPCGTGGTLAGIVCGLNERRRALGFSVLKGGEFLNNNVRDLIKQFVNYSKTNREMAQPSRSLGVNHSIDLEGYNWEINLDYHFDGYAKINRELIEFTKNFEKVNNIPLDPVYTGKMMFGVYDLIKKNYYKEGTKIVAVHTGGLQGVEGMKERIEKILM